MPKYYWNRILFKLRRHFVEVLKLSNSDKSIAWGYTLGSFIAILPTPGFSALLAILVIIIFKKINKPAVILALAIWNVFTVLPIYWLSLKIGDLIFISESTVRFKFEILDQIYNYSRRFLVGNMIVSIPISIANYYIALYFIRNLRAKRVENYNQKKDKKVTKNDNLDI